MKDRLTSHANADHDGTAADFLAEKVVYQEGLMIPLSEDNVIPEPDGEQPADLSPPPTTEKPSARPRSSTKRKSAKEAPVLNVKKILPKNLKLVSVEEESTLPVPKLCHDLDRVLFNPGVYAMQDPRSRVFNFDPYLASIMPVEEFDFDALNEYKTSSKDAKLHALAVKYGSKYNGSTSSMTSMLSHFHYLISAWRTPTFDSLAQSYTPDSFNFTQLTRTPAATFLRYKDGVYAIDADKAYDTQNVLSQLGRSMEKLLTLPREDFEKYRRTESHQLSESERGQEESYHYTTMGDFLMRSQLDAKDARLPGSGVFDLKTRAVVTVRMNVHGYKAGAGYEIRKRHGQWESFDREYSDMIRAAFLKYSLQVRMGRMDGIFVAYHNTQRIFGFQYISLSEMDHAIHGTSSLRLGDQEFKGSLSMLNDLLNRATERFPGKSLRLHVETRETKIPVMYFFAEPVTEEFIDEVQESQKFEVEQIENSVRDLSQQEREAESAEEAEEVKSEVLHNEDADTADELFSYDPQGDAVWDEMTAKVEDLMEDESRGISSVKQAVQSALEETGLLRDKSSDVRERYVDGLVEALAAYSTQGRDGRKVSYNESQASSQNELSDADTRTMSLKDLIVKVAEQMDDTTSTEQGFDQVLAQLVAAPKKPKLADAMRPARAAEISTDTTSGEAADDKLDDNASVLKQAAGELSAPESDEAAEEAAEGEPQQQQQPGEQSEILGLYVTVRNKVNGVYVDRPSSLDKHSRWEIQYNVGEMSHERASRLLVQCKSRRRKVLTEDPEKKAARFPIMFGGKLVNMSKRGVQFREKMTRQEEGRSVFVAWDEQPLPVENDPPRAETGNGKTE